MHYQVYASSAVRPFSKSELIELLDKSRARNTGLGLTGLLLYKGGNFMQVLEGDAAVVRERMNIIEQDPRHHGIVRLIHGDADTRQFADWSMAFRDLSSPEVQAIEGYSEFLNSPLTGGEMTTDPSRAQRLLSIFRRTM